MFLLIEDIYSNDDDDDDDVGKERARKKKTGPKPSKLPTGKSTRVLFQSICQYKHNEFEDPYAEKLSTFSKYDFCDMNGMFRTVVSFKNCGFIHCHWHQFL